MKWLLTLCALSLIFAAPAIAQMAYPHLLHSAGCVDLYDDPTAGTSPSAAPRVQTSGSPDSQCDYDSRISTGALTSDTTFGPLSGDWMGANGGWIQADNDSTAGGDGGWNAEVWYHSPISEQPFPYFTSAAFSSGNDLLIGFGPVNTGFGSTQESIGIVADQYYIVIDLNTATSWTGSLGQIRGPR